MRQQKWLYSLSLRERVGVRDSGCPVLAGVPLPSVARHRRGVLPKGGGTRKFGNFAELSIANNIKTP